MTGSQLPAATNETGTIDADGVAADCPSSALPFRIRVNIARGFPGINSRAETLRRIVASPLVSDAGVLRIGNPAIVRRIALAAVSVGRLNVHAGTVLPVLHIFRGRLPAMFDERLGNPERLSPRDRLGRADGHAGSDERHHQQDDQ